MSSNWLRPVAWVRTCWTSISPAAAGPAGALISMWSRASPNRSFRGLSASGHSVGVKDDHVARFEGGLGGFVLPVSLDRQWQPGLLLGEHLDAAVLPANQVTRVSGVGDLESVTSARHRAALAAHGTRGTPDVNLVTDALYSSTVFVHSGKSPCFLRL